MKKLTVPFVLKKSLALVAIGCLAGSVASADSITITNTDFNNISLVGAYNATYVASPVGHMHLDYTGPDDNAIVGAKGPFGTLAYGSMSFEYSNLVGNGGVSPYAVFGVSANGIWDNSSQRFLIIADSGNQLVGTTTIHVWNLNTSSAYAPVVSGSTLASILGLTYDGINPFGNLVVMRAYAEIGAATGSLLTGSADVNSITVTSTPEPRFTFAIFGVAMLAIAGWRRKLAA